MNSKFIFLILFSFLLSEILSIKSLAKYGSVELKCSNVNRIVFDSSGFNLNEEMYFTLTLTLSISRGSSSSSSSKYLGDEINYEFYPDDINDDGNVDSLSCSKHVGSTTESSSDVNGKKYYKYYAISKNVDNDYLLMDFDCRDGSLKIENTKENKGKQQKIIIIVVVVFFVVLFVVVIVCISVKRRQQQMARTGMKMATAGMMMQAAANCYPQPVMGMASGYGSGYAMNNMPPPPGNMGIQQPVAYSRVGNDVTQIEPKYPNQFVPQSSEKRIKKNKY